MKSILLGPGDTITVQRRLKESVDAHGNPVVGFTAPEPVHVYGIAPKVAVESVESGQDYTTDTSWDIYAPLGTAVESFDRVILPTGEVTEVIGEPMVWDNKPLLNLLSVSGIHFVVVKRK